MINAKAAATMVVLALLVPEVSAQTAIFGRHIEDQATIVADNEEYRVYWPKTKIFHEGQFGEELKCNKPLVDVFVNKPPTTIYTREYLWNTFWEPLGILLERACEEAVLQKTKPGWRSDRNNYLHVRFYFSGVSVTGRWEATVGPILRTDTVAEFARGWFHYWAESDERYGIASNTTVETFIPTIHGTQGHNNQASSSLCSLANGCFETAYENFPTNTYLEFLARNHWITVYRENERALEQEKLMKAFIENISNGGAIDLYQCNTMLQRGENLPWYCDHYFPNRGF